MRALQIVILAASLALAAPAPAQEPDTSEREIVGIANALVAAQRAYDVPALERMLADDYVEVSPLGEVDRRPEVIKFYGPEARDAARRHAPPEIAIDAEQVDVRGDNARLIATETIKMGGAGKSMRVTLQLRKVDGRWLVHTAQYTPIREKVAPSAP